MNNPNDFGEFRIADIVPDNCVTDICVHLIFIRNVGVKECLLATGLFNNFPLTN